MTQEAEIVPPEILVRLSLTGYTLARETTSVWGQRQWRMVCVRCGKVFHPLATTAAVQAMIDHSTLDAGQIVMCRARAL